MLGKRVELFAVVGDQKEIDGTAGLWRFAGRGFASGRTNPVDVQHDAERTPLSQIESGWTTGTDPAKHIAAVQAVIDSGARPFVHFPQTDPTVGIGFYHQVLPQLHGR